MKLKKRLNNDSFVPMNKKVLKKFGPVKALVLHNLIECQSLFDKEKFFKSKSKIAEELNISLSSVKRYLDELIDEGYILSVGKTGNNRNLYSLNETKILSIIDDTMVQNEPIQNEPMVQNEPTDSSNWTNSRFKMNQQMVQNESSKRKNYIKKENKENKKEVHTLSISEKDIKIIDKYFDKFVDSSISDSDKIKDYQYLIECYGSIENCYNALNYDVSVRENWNNQIINRFKIISNSA